MIDSQDFDDIQECFIKDSWQDKAKLHGDSYEASWGDINAIELEINAIAPFIAVLDRSNKVLDFGCGNGYSTYEQYKRNCMPQYYGIDNNELLIDKCHKRHVNWEHRFFVSDLRKTTFDTATFDITYCTRALINLPNWTEQKKALDEMIRVTKPRGKILISEAFWEPLQNLNALRSIGGLKPLVIHDFNCYLHLDKVCDYLGNQLHFNVRKVDFSDMYYIGTRFMRDLLKGRESYKGYTDPINTVFKDIQTKPDLRYNSFRKNFGIQQLLVITPYTDPNPFE